MVEIEGRETRPPLPGEGADLAAFCSFCVMRGFGAEHPLLMLAERLDLEHGVRIGPFTRFYDATIEDAEDSEKLELAWQEASTLHESAAKAAAALASDPECRALSEAGGAAGLGEQMAAMAATVAPAEEAGSRVRLTYVL